MLCGNTKQAMQERNWKEGQGGEGKTEDWKELTRQTMERPRQAKVTYPMIGENFSPKSGEQMITFSPCSRYPLNDFRKEKTELSLIAL